MALPFLFYGINYLVLLLPTYLTLSAEDNELGFYSCLLFTQWEHWALIVMASSFLPFPNCNTYGAFFYMSFLRMYSTHMWFHFTRVLVTEIFVQSSKSAAVLFFQHNKGWSVLRSDSPLETLLNFQKGVTQGESQVREQPRPFKLESLARMSCAG